MAMTEMEMKPMKVWKTQIRRDRDVLQAESYHRGDGGREFEVVLHRLCIPGTEQPDDG